MYGEIAASEDHGVCEGYGVFEEDDEDGGYEEGDVYGVENGAYDEEKV